MAPSAPRLLRLLAPALPLYLFGRWSHPWEHFATDAVVVSVVLSVARLLYTLRRPRGAAEMSPLALARAKRVALGVCVSAIGLGLLLDGFCRTWLAGLGRGIGFDLYLEHAAPIVLLGYLAVVVIYIGIAALLRLGELAAPWGSRHRQSV